MDIAYMKTSNGFTNDSDFVHSDFIEQNLGISIPYLIIISLCTFTGCVGNIMVIGCVLCYKVFSLIVLSVENYNIATGANLQN